MVVEGEFLVVTRVNAEGFGLATVYLQTGISCFPGQVVKCLLDFPPCLRRTLLVEVFEPIVKTSWDASSFIVGGSLLRFLELY